MFYTCTSYVTYFVRAHCLIHIARSILVPINQLVYLATIRTSFKTAPAVGNLDCAVHVDN